MAYLNCFSRPRRQSTKSMPSRSTDCHRSPNLSIRLRHSLDREVAGVEAPAHFGPFERRGNRGPGMRACGSTQRQRPDHGRFVSCPDRCVLDASRAVSPALSSPATADGSDARGCPRRASPAGRCTSGRSLRSNAATDVYRLRTGTKPPAFGEPAVLTSPRRHVPAPRCCASPCEARARLDPHAPR
jgi:hypothetical protein